MHAYRRLIEEQMRAGRMSQSDLARASGVTRQRINQILKSDRERLVHVPDTATVEGFARAFKLKPEVVWVAVAEAMGLPRFVVPSITHQVKDVSDAQLLSELGNRIGLEVSVRPARPTEPQDKKTLELVPDPELSEEDEIVLPAALDTIEGVDEEPGGSAPDES